MLLDELLDIQGLGTALTPAILGFHAFGVGGVSPVLGNAGAHGFAEVVLPDLLGLPGVQGAAGVVDVVLS